MKILVTGTLGFIFSNYVRLNKKYDLIGLDKAVKPYNLDNLNERIPKLKFYFADLMDYHNLNNIFTVESPDLVIGGAAESFVDNSITDIMPFLNSNIIGTQNLINLCLKHNKRYVHISTDEVYGQKLSAGDVPWFETDPVAPRNPYSASKACAEHIVIAAHNTHGLQFQMTRSCNVFGPRQKDENLIPHIIKSILQDTHITIHGDGNNFRQYIYVDDVCHAFNKIVENGKINSIYNIGDENLITNNHMVYLIGELMKKEPKVKYITDRKAHDFGYKVNSDKLRLLGWRPTHKFEDAMRKTIDFYKVKFR